MKWWFAALCAVCAVACSKTDSVLCGDGTVCPTGTVCLDADRAPNRCVLDEQTTVCDGLRDGAFCEGPAFTGICDQGVCLPGCGDGNQDDGEQCDDGNFASHDGCSSRCLSEAPTWAQYHGPWAARTQHSAAYDKTTGKLVIFGGVTPHGQDGATWIFDAQGWHRLEGNGPPGLAGASMVFDANRNVFVLFGGNGIDGAGTNETWELSLAGQWQKAAPSASPPRRTLAAMAYDSFRKKTVLFGGTTDAKTIVELDDTWEYNGTTWTKLTTATIPESRYGAAITYDPVRREVVMFGGRRDVGRRADTWRLSSTTLDWAKFPVTGTTVVPLGRERSAMAFDDIRNTCVLFGGQIAGQNPTNDLWEWNGAGWSQLATSVAPPPRDEHVLAFVVDPTSTPLTSKLMVIGGEATQLYDDVWKLEAAADPMRWRTVDLGLMPESRTAAQTYIPPTGEIVMFGGTPVSLLNPADFWAFGPRGWRRIAAGLTARGVNGLAYDAAGTRLIAVGGANANGTPVQTTDVWNGTAWLTIAPSPVLPELRNPAFAFDEAGLGLLFGGESDRNNVLETFGDTWELTGTTWTKTVSASDPSTPPPAASAALIYDPSRSAFLLVAADGKTWSYANHAWSQLPTFKSPPPREGEQLIYDSLRQRIVMLGGYDSNTYYTNDLWQLDTLPNGIAIWHLLHVVGEPPPPRRQTRAAYSPRLRAIMMFGGSDPTRLGDTWLLRFSSSTPDEFCFDTVDNDNDAQIDDVDPDCQ
ncbi:MAG TPA: hypothetical protein VMZ53_30815 [Kofleriaceae bacterium]|nr:hypothetical protein [Kofleriaceae bacterium]